jgi:hypothetical protein
VLPEGGNAVLSSLAGLDGVTNNNRIAGYPLSVIPERRFNPGSDLACPSSEPRKVAKARRVKMGRPSKLACHQAKAALRRRDGAEPVRDIARSYSVSRSTISRART